MKRYKKDAKCYKCGYGGIEDMHCEESHSGNYIGTVPESAKTPEHINRICRNCGHSWDERPLDSVDHSVSEAIREAIDRSNPFKPAGEAAKPGSLEDRFKNVKYKRCWPTQKEIQEWMDALADAIAPAVGIPAEILKRPFPPADPHVLEVGDILTVGEGDVCEHEILAQPTEGWWCVSGYDKLFNKTELYGLTLIRKGPKVHKYPDVKLRGYSKDMPYIELDKSSIPLMYNGKHYDMTLTEINK